MDRLAFTLPAPAKLNLFLNIIGRRPDGYHQLQTAFQLIDLCDELAFEPADELSVACPGVEIPLEDNLVFRAADALRAATGCNAGAHITVDKRIPEGGGLGGGSSDAATTLVGLDRLWSLGLSREALMEIATGLGADVPVFVYGRCAWGEGIGEILQPIDFSEKIYLIVQPECAISTARIFAADDLTRNGTAITIAHFLRQGSENVCEPVVRRLYPAVDAVCRWLSQWGDARMTGTGSCVFVALDTEAEARQILTSVPEAWRAFVAHGITESPLYDALPG
ncbi:MAG TPA: 4-(cytidine 5'-diphospho)-2-C-methyl-D-erythritol kinase [Pseudomonadales bacterium]|nr:4-(cytidine 5'-diphospho)-2-C-methyl-D-erythritol kinase [Pseudomonadales bacterium]